MISGLLAVMAWWCPCRWGLPGLGTLLNLERSRDVPGRLDGAQSFYGRAKGKKQLVPTDPKCLMAHYCNGVGCQMQ